MSQPAFNESYTSSTTRRGVKRRRLNQEDFVSFDQTAKSWKVGKLDWGTRGLLHYWHLTLTLLFLIQSNSHAEGDVIIDEVDTEGKFIRITNKSEEDMPIVNWMIKSTAGDREVSFKFHSRAKIMAGKSITVSENTKMNSFIVNMSYCSDLFQRFGGRTSAAVQHFDEEPALAPGRCHPNRAAER
jgi:hypothetical protein